MRTGYVLHGFCQDEGMEDRQSNDHKEVAWYSIWTPQLTDDIPGSFLCQRRSHLRAKPRETLVEHGSRRCVNLKPQEIQPPQREILGQVIFSDNKEKALSLWISYVYCKFIACSPQGNVIYVWTGSLIMDGDWKFERVRQVRT